MPITCISSIHTTSVTQGRILTSAGREQAEDTLLQQNVSLQLRKEHEDKPLITFRSVESRDMWIQKPLTEDRTLQMNGAPISRIDTRSWSKRVESSLRSGLQHCVVGTRHQALKTQKASSRTKILWRCLRTWKKQSTAFRHGTSTGI